jgi:tryptophan 7-halogenase
LFRVDSWVQVMLGQRLAPRDYHAAARIIGEQQLRDALASLSKNIAGAVRTMPTHETSLTRVAEAQR